MTHAQSAIVAREVKALSIQQPYAWLIAAGHKDIENRDWPTNFRGPVLIHAGKKMYDGFEDAGDWMWPEIDAPCDFDMGGIVGEAEIVDCVTASKSRWFFGRYGFVIRNARLTPFRPCRGQLGFFTPDFTPVAPRVPIVRAPKIIKPSPQAALDLAVPSATRRGV